MENVLPSISDVRRLEKSRDAGARRTLAEKLGRSYAMKLFRPRERAIADDIVRTIAHDVEVEVRKALAQTISSSNQIPHEVAVLLAKDVIEVAEPILRESDLLGDELLVEIIKSRTEAHRQIIASRKTVSEPVAAAIIQHGDVPAVSTLVANAGASISESSLGQTLDKFGHVVEVANPIADRATLPLAIAERLVALVSERLKAQFAGNTVRARQYADGLAASMNEGAAVLLGGGEAETLDLLALIDQLHAAGKLQPSLVLRAGRGGQRELMQAAVSRLAGENYSAVAAAFANDNSARGLLRGVGLIDAEIDEVLGSSRHAVAGLTAGHLH
jgi:uncharacterized protein (DUF2336 family)